MKPLAPNCNPWYIQRTTALHGLASSGAARSACARIYQGHDSNVYVHVENGKGGWPRGVQALPGHNEDVWMMREGRPDDEKVFERIPRHLDVHSVRREFAQALYQHYANGRDLPPPSGRLKRQDYDRAAAEQVIWVLGHNRIDVVLRHYIR